MKICLVFCCVVSCLVLGQQKVTWYDGQRYTRIGPSHHDQANIHNEIDFPRCLIECAKVSISKVTSFEWTF